MGFVFIMKPCDITASHQTACAAVLFPIFGTLENQVLTTCVGLEKADLELYDLTCCVLCEHMKHNRNSIYHLP